MPRKYDREAILKAYEELKTIRAVSDHLDVPRQSVRDIVYQALGKCIQCASPVIPGKGVCIKHERYWSDRIAAKRKERRRLGLCQECDQPYELPSRTHCARHRIQYLEWCQRRDEKKPKDPRRLNSDEGAKLYAIRKKYGETGVACYTEADGKCEICGRNHEEVALHIHHINCDEKDHSQENLICLCRDHHIAVHGILRTPAISKFLNWFSQTYIQEP